LGAGTLGGLERDTALWVGGSMLGGDWLGTVGGWELGGDWLGTVGGWELGGDWLGIVCGWERDCGCVRVLGRAMLR
jgi:hypothetical protein